MDRRGFSIVELMVVVGISGLLMVGVQKTLQSAFKANRAQSAVSVRDGAILVDDALTQSAAPKIMALAVEGGNRAPLCTELRDCVKGSNTACSGSCSFQLSSASGARLTGSDANPLRLKLDGTFCRNTPSPTLECPLESIGRFRRNGDLISLWTEVRVSPNLGSAPLATLARKTGFEKGIKTYDGSKTGKVVTLPLAKTEINACNSEMERMVGFHADGRTVDCQAVIQGTPVSNKPKALPPGAKPCPDDTILKGFTLTGIPICHLFPRVWLYNNTLILSSGPGVPTHAAVTTHLKGAVPCGGDVHNALCGEGNDAKFCYILSKPYFKWMPPKGDGDYSLDVRLDKGDMSVNAGFSGNEFRSTLNGASKSMPVANAYVLGLLRCLSPVQPRKY